MLIKCFLFLAALLMSAALAFRGNWMRRRQASGPTGQGPPGVCLTSFATKE